MNCSNSINVGADLIVGLAVILLAWPSAGSVRTHLVALVLGLVVVLGVVLGVIL